MCVDFGREQFDLFIMLSVGCLKHVYVLMRATSIIYMSKPNHKPTSNVQSQQIRYFLT